MWHRHAVIYQIYPLSFQDSDGDGRGDLRGILARLDHVSSLGVHAVWLCPVYRSPLHDFGYDVSDYTSIDPVFGSLEDFDRLLNESHRRGLRLLLDFVPNHTSDSHPWFTESRSSRHSPKHDWYLWADPRPDGGPPNNWLSRFGGSAWKWEPRRKQFYLHSFLESQPDLNLRQPEVRAALADAMRFWLRRGVDGFRIDAAAVLAKDPELRDDPPNPEATAETPPPERNLRQNSDGQLKSIDWLAEMRDVADAFPERVLLGEVDTAHGRISKYYGAAERPALHLPLNYLLLDTPWHAEQLAGAIGEYLRRIPSHGAALWAIGGQDKPRVASKLGDAQARNVALLAFSLPGAGLFFAGDEIGMQQFPVPSDQALDPFERQVPGYGMNRDPERRPMQWDAGENAGFSTGTPWLPVAPDYTWRNVEAAGADPRSLLSFYRKLLALRRAEPALTEGVFEGLSARGGLLTFVRRSKDRYLRVIVNPEALARTADLAETGRVVLSTHLDREDEQVIHRVELRPDEGVILAAD